MRIICSALTNFLFAIYLNDITCKLSVSVRGCHVAGIYVGVVMYADDLLPISSTRSDLRRMTKICEDEMKWLDMHFNSKKSSFKRFGKRYTL